MPAVFYTIKREMSGEEKQTEHPDYSYASAPDRNVIEIDSISENARAIDGRKRRDALPAIDE